MESALVESNFGLPDEYELQWSPLQPFDDWIIHVSKDGHNAAVIVTAHQMSMSEHLISLVNENASGRLIKIIATPKNREIDDKLHATLAESEIHLLQY